MKDSGKVVFGSQRFKAPSPLPLRDPFRREDKNIQQSEIVFISLQIVRKNSRDDLLDFAEQK